jgi:hypothetical protein
MSEETVKLRHYHAARWDEKIVMEMGRPFPS